MSARTALAGLLLVATPASADDGVGIDQLLNFAANGCVPYAMKGTPVDTFATKERAQRLDDKTARPFLGTERGAVYLKTDTRHPIALTAKTDGACTVNARFPGDLTPMIEAVDDYFVGPGSRFYPGRVFEEASVHGGWVTHRIYLAQRGDKQIVILFSADPKAPALEQIAVTVMAERKPPVTPSPR